MGLLPDWNSPQLSHLTGYEPLTLWFWFLKSGALRMSEALLEAQNGDVMPLSAHNGNEEPGSQKNSQDKKEDQKDSGPTTSDSAPTTAQVSSFSAGSGGGGDPPNYHNGNQKKEPEDGSESQINKDNTKKQRYKKPLINVCKI